MDGPDAFLAATIDGVAQTYPIEPLSVCRIGRDHNNTIVLTDALASRSHAMVRRDSTGICYLLDVGSRNGTRLNGRPVNMPMALANGDRITIGSQAIDFAQVIDTGAGNDGPGHAATQIMLAQSLISVLVIDIRGYTVLSQELGEERISKLMSELFRAAGEVLYRARAWSQKYIGDAVMGVWLHDKATIEPLELAGMLEVIELLRDMTETLSRQFELARPLRFGAAINSGHASIGNMGSASLSDFTALGDTVNKAFRLEAASKELGRDVVLGWRTVELLRTAPPSMVDHATADVVLKGYANPERVCGFTFAELPQLVSTLATKQPTMIPLRGS